MADQGFGSRRTPDQQEAWERQCYGCLAADFKQSVEMSLPVRVAGTDPSTGYGMVAMSTLSDAQEMIERGLYEEARQAINRAKLLIADYWMRRNDG